MFIFNPTANQLIVLLFRNWGYFLRKDQSCFECVMSSLDSSGKASLPDKKTYTLLYWGLIKLIKLIIYETDLYESFNIIL